jgi:hypothetical protein
VAARQCGHRAHAGMTARVATGGSAVRVAPPSSDEYLAPIV